MNRPEPTPRLTGPGWPLLTDRVAVVTGTAGGQGRAAALLFARHGAQVEGCDLNVDGALETVALGDAAGLSLRSTQPVDLTDQERVSAWIGAIGDRYGRIDVLYNNASSARFAPLEEMPFRDWSFTLRHELDLLFTVCQAAWPYLKASGRGAVINTSSGGALRGFADFPSTAHSAAKAGVLGLTRALAAEGAPARIRVNAISPGLVRSPATSAMLAAPGVESAAATQIPLGRVAEGDDIAHAALYLASDWASYVTGHNLVVDGGLTAITTQFPPRGTERPWQVAGANQSRPG